MDVQSQVFVRVVQFCGESEKLGTAFIADVDGVDVLVTARHLCIDEPEEQVTVRHAWSNGGAPQTLIMERVGDRQTDADVAMFAIPEGLFSGLLSPIPLTPDGIAWGQEIHILGFPYGMSFEIAPNAHMPVIKRGIFSGSYQSPGNVDTIVIDVIANPGFSGGPLVFYKQSTGAFAFGGVVFQNVLAPQEEPTEANPNPPHVTSGLALVASVVGTKFLAG